MHREEEQKQGFATTGAAAGGADSFATPEVSTAGTGGGVGFLVLAHLEIFSCKGELFDKILAKTRGTVHLNQIADFFF